MLSFFKFPFSLRKHPTSEDSVENVMMDILRKRQKHEPSLNESIAIQKLEKFRNEIRKNRGSSIDPVHHYEKMKKILKDLDNELV